MACWAGCRANLANSQAPEAFLAPRGIARLSPPLKTAAPAVGPGKGTAPTWSRKLLLAETIRPQLPGHIPTVPALKSAPQVAPLWVRSLVGTSFSAHSFR